MRVCVWGVSGAEHVGKQEAKHHDKLGEEHLADEGDFVPSGEPGPKVK